MHHKLPYQPCGTPTQRLAASSVPPTDDSAHRHKAQIAEVVLYELEINDITLQCEWIHTHLSAARCSLYKRQMSEDLQALEIDDNVPKSRFSRIRMINTPGTSSLASSFSLIGFHWSVPGIRPCPNKTGTNFSSGF